MFCYCSFSCFKYICNAPFNTWALTLIHMCVWTDTHIPIPICYVFLVRLWSHSQYLTYRYNSIIKETTKNCSPLTIQAFAHIVCLFYLDTTFWLQCTQCTHTLSLNCVSNNHRCVTIPKRKKNKHVITLAEAMYSQKHIWSE